MGSRTFDGVRFFAYTNDHDPPHVHGFYAEVEVILELDFGEKRVRFAKQDERTRPQNAKRSDVNHIVHTARKFTGEVVALWEGAQ